MAIANSKGTPLQGRGQPSRGNIENRKVLADEMRGYLKKFDTIDPKDRVNMESGFKQEAERLGISNPAFNQFVSRERTALAPASAAPAAASSGSNSGASTPRLDAGPQTPRLDRLAQMQNMPVGSLSTLGQRRSLESEAGRARRLARSLQRSGFQKAAESVAALSAEQTLKTPALRTESYRTTQEALQGRLEAEADATKRAELEDSDLRRRLLEEQLKALKGGRINSLSTPAPFSNPSS